MDLPCIVFQAEPQRRTVSRNALDIAKLARAQGIKVVFEPDDGRPLRYVVRKGLLDDIVKDPIAMLAIGVPIGIVTNLISSWIYDRIKKVGQSPAEARVHIEVVADGKRIVYDHLGTEVSADKAEQMLREFNESLFAHRPRMLASPFPDMPVPVYLEHTPKVVGWTALNQGPHGLYGEPTHITDRETLKRIDIGELTGLSVSGIVKRSECSICGDDYVRCNHVAGSVYNRRKCINRISEIEFLEVSVVAEPTNPMCYFDQGRNRKVARRSG